jgi:hypothetical protein
LLEKCASCPSKNQQRVGINGSEVAQRVVCDRVAVVRRRCQQEHIGGGRGESAYRAVASGIADDAVRFVDDHQIPSTRAHGR